MTRMEKYYWKRYTAELRNRYATPRERAMADYVESLRNYVPKHAKKTIDNHMKKDYS